MSQLSLPFDRYELMGYGRGRARVMAAKETGLLNAAIFVTQRLVIRYNYRRGRKYRGRFMLLGRSEPYLGFWEDGLFNNPHAPHLPKGGYIIRAHWEDDPRAYPVDFMAALSHA